MYARSLESLVTSNVFGRQMRFVAGPRQVGKTTMAKAFLKKQGCEHLYYNWDLKSVRARYRDNPDFFYDDLLEKPVSRDIIPWICFDEIHKVTDWKNILKAHFDQHESTVNTIVTGSARLDLFKQSGDSLAGRYFLFHLLPISISEMNGRLDLPMTEGTAEKFIEARLSQGATHRDHWEALLRWSGFPEPLVSASDQFHRLWRRNYLEKTVYEDLRDLSHIRDLDKVAQLVAILPQCVGSPLSVNALREDLEVNHTTAKNYLKYLELVYFLFFITPFSKNIRRGLKKESKVYLYDWTHIKGKGPRFENYVAVELNRWVHAWNDSGVGEFGLHFVKITGGVEVDFLVTREGEPWFLVEAKYTDQSIGVPQKNIAKQLGNIPLVQVIHTSGVAKKYRDGFYVISADRFFG